MSVILCGCCVLEEGCVERGRWLLGVRPWFINPTPKPDFRLGESVIACERLGGEVGEGGMGSVFVVLFV